MFEESSQTIFCLCGRMKLTMSVPQAAFAVKKIRQNNERFSEKAKNFQNFDAAPGLSPMNYSSKFMNSVWGMYNRYSVHNLKKNYDSLLHHHK